MFEKSILINELEFLHSFLLFTIIFAFILISEIDIRKMILTT